MKNSPDPGVHRQLEQTMVQHVEKLLDDDRLRIDTTRGRRPVTGFIRDVSKSDRGVDLKRIMSELGRPDRDLEAQMPHGQSLEVVLSQRSFWLFKKTVGRLKVVCVSPVRTLLNGEAPKPLTSAEVSKLLQEIPPPLKGVPTTLVLVSTSGFTIEAHEKAERSTDRVLVLTEPNDAGGWSVYGPAEIKSLLDLLDPEADEQKRQRVRDFIEQSKVDLTGSGIATDKLAAKTQLPLQLIESELKSYAQANPGLTAKRLDGRLVLFRQSAAPVPGGSPMPFIDRLRSLFGRQGDNEKKIALLSERRTALSQQRDRSYEEMASLDQKEVELKEQFKNAASPMTKRRITTQLLQMRKDAERRQQLLAVLNQQINVVSTHLHNLELVQQGQSAALPDTEELAADAAAAEDMLAELEANTELAASVGAISPTGLSEEEQALYEELERETGNVAASPPQPQRPQSSAQPTARAPERGPAAPSRPERQRGEAEPG